MEGVSAPRPLQGSVGTSGFRFFLSDFLTLGAHHPLHEAGKSLCVLFEVCNQASEGAQVPHDHVGLIEFFLNSM
jgi:hypothetical protein